jgi:hypothetical protein
MLGLTIARSGRSALALGTSLGYVALAGQDSALVGSTVAAQASLVALAVAVVVLGGAYAWALEGISTLLSVAAPAISFAFGFGLLAIYPPQSWTDVLFVAAAAGAGFAFALSAEPLLHGQGERPASIYPVARLRGPSTLDLVGIPPLFMAVPLIAAVAGLWQSVVAVFLVLVLTASWHRYRRGAFGGATKHSLGQSAQLLCVAVGGVLFLHLTSQVGAFLLWFLGLLLDWIVLKACKEDYERVMEMEESPERRANMGKPTPQDASDSAMIWGRIAARTVSAVACLLGFTLAVVPSMGWIAAERNVYLGPVAVGGVLILIMACCLALPANFQASRQRAAADQGRPPKPSTIAVYAAVAAGISAFAIGLSAVTSGHPIVPAVTAAIQALLIAVFAAESVSANGLKLNLAQTSRRSRLIVTTTAGGVWGVAFWALTQGIGTPEGPVSVVQSLWVTLIAILLSWLLVASSTSAVYANGGRLYRTPYAPTSNVMQDMSLLGLMWLVTGWLPQTASAHFPIEPLWDHWVNVGIVLSGFVVIYVQSLAWILRNNDSHNGRECRRRGLAVEDYAELGSSKEIRFRSLPGRVWAYFRSTEDATEPEAEVSALDGHTAVQNSIGLSLTFITVLGFFIWVVLPTA